MINNYPKAYKEVIEILKNVPADDVKKIKKEVLEMFNEEMDKDYNYQIDKTKTFEEQVILDETRAILANLYRDYWVTPEQKARILGIQANQIIKLERQKNKLKQKQKLENKVIENQESANNLIEESQALQVIECKTTRVKRIVNAVKSMFNKILRFE